MRYNIRGLKETQLAMQRATAAVKPTGALGRAVQFLGISTHRHLVNITHVDTGAYKASQLIQYEGAARIRISLNPSARNPRTRALVTSYAHLEEAHGGSHASYKITFNYAKSELAPRAAAMIVSEVS